MSVTDRNAIDEGFGLAEKCVDLWADGRQQEAVDKLISACATLPVCAEHWSWLVTTWQMRLGQSADEGLAFLRKYPEIVPEWYFASALCLYKQHGKTTLTKAALHAAYDVGSPIGMTMIGRWEERFGDDGLALIGEDSYPVAGKPLWEATPGALEWLGETFREFTLSTMPDELDEKHPKFKLFKTNFELGTAHLRRGDLRKTKQSLRMALKEARHFGPFSWPYETVLALLIQAGMDENQPDAEAALEYQAASVDAYCQNDLAKAVRLYRIIGERFEMVNGQTSKAADCFSKAVELMDKIENDVNPLDAHEQSELLTSAGCYWTKEDGMLRSIELFKRAIKLRSEYVGDNHPELLRPMMEMYKCLINLEGGASEAAALKERMLQIEPNVEKLIKDNGHLTHSAHSHSGNCC